MPLSQQRLRELVAISTLPPTLIVALQEGSVDRPSYEKCEWFVVDHTVTLPNYPRLREYAFQLHEIVAHCPDRSQICRRGLAEAGSLFATISRCPLGMVRTGIGSNGQPELTLGG